MNNGAGERTRTSDRPVAVCEHVVSFFEVRSSSMSTFNSRALYLLSYPGTK